MAPRRDVTRQPNLLTMIPETEPVKNTSAMAREPIQAGKKHKNAIRRGNVSWLQLAFYVCPIHFQARNMKSEWNEFILENSVWELDNKLCAADHEIGNEGAKVEVKPSFPRSLCGLSKLNLGLPEFFWLSLSVFFCLNWRWCRLSIKRKKSDLCYTPKFVRYWYKNCTDEKTDYEPIKLVDFFNFSFPLITDLTNVDQQYMTAASIFFNKASMFN